MNCYHARQLISPYLDGQLTGREMLDLGDHLAGCESCQGEMSSLRQIKSLLRGLHTPSPRLEFSRRLSSQEILAESAGPKYPRFPKPITLTLRPQRGRRLMSALALSCLTLLALAPASREGQITASVSPFSGFPASSGLTSPTGRGFAAPLSRAAGATYRFGSPPQRGFVTFTSADVAGADISDQAFLYPQSYEGQPYDGPVYRVQSYDSSVLPFPPGTVPLTSYRPR